MGDVKLAWKTTFSKSLRLSGSSEMLSSDGGALIIREYIERTGLVLELAGGLHDGRRASHVRRSLVELLNTRLVLLCQGWTDQDDADALRHDPSLVHAAGGEAPDHGLASQPTLSRLGETLRTGREALRRAVVASAIRELTPVEALEGITIDVDSFPVAVHGRQAGAEYNGHYGGVVYHPLVASIANRRVILSVQLRPGTAHTAAGVEDFVLELLGYLGEQGVKVRMLRFDAGFVAPDLLALLESKEIGYVGRIKNNSALDSKARDLMETMSVQPKYDAGDFATWCIESTYKAGSWAEPRRAVLIAEHEPGELFVKHYWLVTNLAKAEYAGPELLDLYRARGTAESSFGEFKSVVEPRLAHFKRNPDWSAPVPAAFLSNEADLLLAALAFNIMSAVRRLAEESLARPMSLRTLRERLLKVAIRVVSHARTTCVTVARAAEDLWFALWRTKLPLVRA